MEDEFFLHPIVIEETLNEIKTAVEERARALPEERNVRKKLDGWVLDITELQTKATYIQQHIIPQIRRDLQFIFEDPNRILRVMVDGTAKSMFLEMLKEFPETRHPKLRKSIYEMSKLPDEVESLAYLGNAALLLAAAHHLWTSNTPSKGTLDQMSQQFKDKKYQAQLERKWRLYENTIGFDHKPRSNIDEENHDRSTLVEAVFGLLYIKSGLDAVIKAMPLFLEGPDIKRELGPSHT
jgi:23S rRNA maturation mini-RNase III